MLDGAQTLLSQQMPQAWDPAGIALPFIMPCAVHSHGRACTELAAGWLLDADCSLKHMSSDCLGLKLDGPALMPFLCCMWVVRETCVATILKGQSGPKSSCKTF